MNPCQRFNLHSHTYRCGHALGSDEEYVRAAIDAGFETMGFSDHVFLPGIDQPGMRGSYKELGDYLNSIGELQEKYKDKIEILKAFEAEWYGKQFEPYYRELLSEKKVDYLILGQHCFFDRRFYWYAHYPAKEHASLAYAQDLVEGMDSGLFLYVAHPDLFMIWHGAFDTAAYEITRIICEKSLEKDIPLEVNMAYSRRYKKGQVDLAGVPYPNKRFWEIAAHMGVSCLFGVDAHSPKDYERTDYLFFKKFAKDLGLKLVDPREKLKLK